MAVLRAFIIYFIIGNVTVALVSAAIWACFNYIEIITAIVKYGFWAAMYIFLMVFIGGFVTEIIKKVTRND